MIYRSRERYESLDFELNRTLFEDAKRLKDKFDDATAGRFYPATCAEIEERVMKRN